MDVEGDQRIMFRKWTSNRSGEVIPAGNSSFQLAQNTARSSKIQFGSTSIEYRIASDFSFPGHYSTPGRSNSEIA
ncbi:hypothetical protein ALC60_02209 [Trachymyrmex zeteki]|uniref:Uncharacterized protein n=1 Tax=Mycetomoellerius zeteki TaxID=64791 RepID=A0A151XDW0_9HYME|nr:hypothetical protein ALC60_02209 [Trachymyrmex zeteki]